MHIGTLSHCITHEDVVSKVVCGTLQGHRHLLGNGPHKADEFPGDGHSDNVGVFAFGHQALGAFTQPDWCLPTDVLNKFGLVFEAQLSLAADLRGIAVRPGAFDEHTAGMGVAGLRNAPLLAPLARRIF